MLVVEGEVEVRWCLEVKVEAGFVVVEAREEVSVRAGEVGVGEVGEVVDRVAADVGGVV